MPPLSSKTRLVLPNSKPRPIRPPGSAFLTPRRKTITVGEYSSELLAKAIQLGFISSVVKGAPYSANGTTTIDTSLADGTRINRTINYTIYETAPADCAVKMVREYGSQTRFPK